MGRYMAYTYALPIIPSRLQPLSVQKEKLSYYVYSYKDLLSISEKIVLVEIWKVEILYIVYSKGLREVRRRFGY